MSVKITFYTLAERKPSHGEPIIWLRPTYSFHMTGFEPEEVEAEYCWFHYEDGEFTGTQISYSKRSKKIPENCKLEILFDGTIADETSLWCPVKEYWKCFKAHDKLVDKFNKKQWNIKRQEWLDYKQQIL